MGIKEFFADNAWVAAFIGIVGTCLIVLIVWLICRCRRHRRYDYTALNEDLALPHKIQMEKQAARNEFRDTALMNCQFYLRSNEKYKFQQQLGDIGNRLDCSHFLVKSGQKVELIMTMSPRHVDCLINLDRPTNKVLNDLLHSLQYPFIYPVFEVDTCTSERFITLFQSYNEGGSLKDVIYRSRCMDSYQAKYQFRAKGLPLEHVKMFGLQILKGLQFLSEKGFPPHAHLHTGNIMVQNMTCKIAAYESNFFGSTPKIFPLVKKKLKDNRDAIETLCFGHLIFEMSAGCECSTAHPEPQQIIHIQHTTIVELLNYIFENESRKYPTIKEIINHPFFADVTLQALKKFNPAPVLLTANMKQLLKSARSKKAYKPRERKGSAPAYTSTEDETDSGRTRKKRRSSSTGIESRRRKSGSGETRAPLPPPPPPPIQRIQSTPSLTSVPEVTNTRSSSSGRQALLGDIRTGLRLKKTLTNDRSAPKV